MNTNCLNCGEALTGRYCSSCGQSAKVGRLSWTSLVSEFIHTLTHADRSLLGTTFRMFIQPGTVLQEYISGKRKKYQAPVAFFLIWVTLSIFTHRMILLKTGFHPVFLEGLTFSSPESIHVFIEHGQWFYILTFPLIAAMLYVFIAHPVFSYIEALVITMYTFSMDYAFFVICYLVGGGLFSLNVLHWAFYLFQILFSVFFTIWVCIDLFHKKGIPHFWIRLLLFTLINTIVVLKFLELLSITWIRLLEIFNHH